MTDLRKHRSADDPVLDGLCAYDGGPHDPWCRLCRRPLRSATTPFPGLDGSLELALRDWMTNPPDSQIDDDLRDAAEAWLDARHEPVSA